MRNPIIKSCPVWRKRQVRAVAALLAEAFGNPRPAGESENDLGAERSDVGVPSALERKEVCDQKPFEEVLAELVAEIGGDVEDWVTAARTLDAEETLSVATTECEVQTARPATRSELDVRENFLLWHYKSKHTTRFQDELDAEIDRRLATVFSPSEVQRVREEIDGVINFQELNRLVAEAQKVGYGLSLLKELGKANTPKLRSRARKLLLKDVAGQIKPSFHPDTFLGGCQLDLAKCREATNCTFVKEKCAVMEFQVRRAFESLEERLDPDFKRFCDSFLPLLVSRRVRDPHVLPEQGVVFCS